MDNPWTKEFWKLGLTALQYVLLSLYGIATLAFVIIQLWAVGVGSSATLHQIDNNDKDWYGKDDGSHDYDQNPWT